MNETSATQRSTTQAADQAAIRRFQVNSRRGADGIARAYQRDEVA